MDRREEFANALTHGMAAVFFLIVTPFLLISANQKAGITWPVVCYVLCLLIMYMNSTVYHAMHQAEIKHLLRIVDHVSIFLLIGGTFTPIVVYNMGEWNGYPFLILFWGLMFCGIIFKIFFTGRFKLASTLIYVGVAWAGAAIAWPLTNNLSARVIFFIVAGGIFYTAGTLFYMQKKLLYHHAIWHLFVIAGSAFHLLAVRYSILH